MSKAARMIKPCRCRNCGDIYEEIKSRADYKGYCSQRCVHEKAKRSGYIKRKSWPREPNGSEYDCLKRCNAIGSVPVDKDGIVK